MKMENTVSSTVCRTCLKSKGRMCSLFPKDNLSGALEQLSEMLISCTQMQVVREDGLPDQICSGCLQQLRKAYTFREKCLQTDTILRTHMLGGHINNHETKEDIEHQSTLDKAEDNVNAHGNDTRLNDELNHEEQSSQNGCNDSDNAPRSELVMKKKFRRKTDGRSLMKRSARSSTVKTGPYICPHCNKELKTYSSLKYHMQLHSEDTPYLCSECGESFKTKNSYDGHMSIHDISNPHKCDQCGKRYRQAASLRNHLMTHTGERPFLCMVCGKGCIQKSDFKKHMLTHTNEKSYVCNICGHKYRFSHNLKLHIRSHTGEKPYDCKICSKRFSAKDHLKRHTLIHTGEKPFRCEFCEKSFNRASTLAVHKKIHTGQRDHVCTECGKSFIQAHCLQTHMNTHNNTGRKTMSELKANEEITIIMNDV